jgi:uncharacterized protein (DUF433 family)
MESEERVARWIEGGAGPGGAGDARLVGSGLPVATIVGYLAMAGGDTSRVAEDCAVPWEAVEVALAYYQQHRPAIDARIAAEAQDGY